jgi:Integrase core domain
MGGSRSAEINDIITYGTFRSKINTPGFHSTASNCTYHNVIFVATEKLFRNRWLVCLNSCENRIGVFFISEKPIVSIGYLARVQMDLIDMRSIRDGEFQWILHTKDHFSKFSWAYPLCSKEAQPVAEKLLQQFYSFGVPKILQSDNGKEFVAKVIKVFIFISSRSRATSLILNRI